MRISLKRIRQTASDGIWIYFVLSVYSIRLKMLVPLLLTGIGGGGKTFFVKQVKMVMDAHNGFIRSDASKDKEEIINIRKNLLGNNAFVLEPQVCVYYDVWENDNDSDPVMSLVYAILSHVNTDFSFKKLIPLRQEPV